MNAQTVVRVLSTSTSPFQKSQALTLPLPSASPAFGFTFGFTFGFVPKLM